MFKLYEYCLIERITNLAFPKATGSKAIRSFFQICRFCWLQTVFLENGVLSVPETFLCDITNTKHCCHFQCWVSARRLTAPARFSSVMPTSWTAFIIVIPHQSTVAPDPRSWDTWSIMGALWIFVVGATRRSSSPTRSVARPAVVTPRVSPAHVAAALKVSIAVEGNFWSCRIMWADGVTGNSPPKPLDRRVRTFLA